MPNSRRFQLVLIKPSHYDDDGYVVQWLRSAIPSNSLASVYALAIDSAERQALGEDVAIDITALDETNTRVRVPALIDLVRAHGGLGMIGLVGVQSNQFPRALDLARPFRKAGIPVVIGGFHVGGCLAMLPDMEPNLQAAIDLGCSLFAGEAEGRFDQVLQDAASGTLKPVYNFINDLPALTGQPVPYLPARLIARTAKNHASFDAGRGCPFECSFCTIINVQGRKSRRRTPDDVEHLIRQHWAEGVRRFFITDDNFARNKDWEPIFDRIALLRERDNINVRLIIQVDTLCHKIENFVEKARLAGVTRVFIGLENINPANLQAAKKRQNKITEYRNMLLAWKRAGIITYAGYILGFPADTPDSIREDIEIIKKELPVDILEFFCLTPLPGSEDHQTLWQKKTPMDADLNKYDLEHVVTDHPKMSRAEWQAIYNAAWEAYYTPAHMETIVRRAAATGMGLSRLISVLFAFSSFVSLEKVHPLQGGIFRLKYRTDRRPTLPVVPAWKFYPELVWEIASKHARAGLKWLWLDRMKRRILSDPQHKAYMDSALKFVAEEDDATLELFSHNEGARAETARQRRVAEVIAAAR